MNKITIMQKLIIKQKRLWVLAATLVCGASVMTSCSSDDNPVTDDGLKEQVVGKWIHTDTAHLTRVEKE